MGGNVRRVSVHGEVLRALMHKHGMSSSGLAKRVGVSPALIRMLTTGRRTSTKFVTAQRIATAMGEPMSTFATAPPQGRNDLEESA